MAVIRAIIGYEGAINRDIGAIRVENGAIIKLNKRIILPAKISGLLETSLAPFLGFCFESRT